VTGDPADRHAPANRDSLASDRLADVLAVQVQTRPSNDCGRSAASDSAHGFREPDVGSGTDRQRALAEARNSCFASHRSQVEVRGQVSSAMPNHRVRVRRGTPLSM